VQRNSVDKNLNQIADLANSFFKPKLEKKKKSPLFCNTDMSVTGVYVLCIIGTQSGLGFFFGVSQLTIFAVGVRILWTLNFSTLNFSRVAFFLQIRLPYLQNRGLGKENEPQHLHLLFPQVTGPGCRVDLASCTVQLSWCMSQPKLAPSPRMLFLNLSSLLQR
jgi:hypothetical protein